MTRSGYGAGLRVAAGNLPKEEHITGVNAAGSIIMPGEGCNDGFAYGGKGR